MRPARAIGRRLRRGRGAAVARGRHPVRIDEIVSPLRYDIVVRQRFFELLAGLDERDKEDLPGLIERARSEPYFIWFRDVAVPRFRPNLIGDENAVDRAFAERVEASIHLVDGFTSGYDPSQPIVLLSGSEILPTESGKRLGQSVYGGDGCHRLALLRLAGVEELGTGEYLLETRPRLAPLDNTAMLLPRLPISEEAYFRFLSLCYAAGRPCGTEKDLVAQVRDNDPDRLAELRRVLEVDLPLLRGEAVEPPLREPG